jgi:tetratricopeptide (TPR) repeat protein
VLGSLLKRLLGSRAPALPDAVLVDGPWLAETLRLQQQRAHADVVARCEAALKSAPDQANVLNLLSAALLAQGKTKDGIRHLRSAIDADPSAKAHAQLGNVLAATGDFDGAIASYRAALALEPESVEAWSTLGALLKALARYDEAEECCAAGLRLDATNAGLKYTLATVMFEQARVVEAIAAVRESLALQPDNPGGAQRAAAHAELFGYLGPGRRIP